MGVCYQEEKPKTYIKKIIKVKPILPKMELNANFGRHKASINIIQNIFSFLSRTNKFKLINHNKKIQNYIGINIIDYKNVSGRYFVGEKNGNGKEHTIDTDKIIFEGEYLNGKKNGKGKEYYEYGMLSKLKFEGEYLNGNIIEGKGYDDLNNMTLLIEKDGKGKEYFLSGKIQFEWEYINGKKWNRKGYNKEGNEEYEIKDGKGIIKEYDYWGNLIFEGEYLNGERSGKGKEFIQFKNTLVYEAEYLYGKEMDLEKDI
jgi:antitoxin component YwqK of YwqJK toxin-antitoxin module